MAPVTSFLFICSSLEKGKDGVGDYTRRLGGQLSLMGNRSTLLSLSDKFISEYSVEYQKVGDQVLEVIRIPKHYNFWKRRNILLWILEKYKPRWTSLQYVGFGFHRYGLPISLILILQLAKNNSKLQIMFHELWCGMGHNAGVKENVLGFLQKKVLQILVFSLKPQKIFTSIESYKSYLDGVNIKSDVIPIFGNIPLNQMPDAEGKKAFLDTSKLSILEREADHRLVIGTFGTVYSIADLQQILCFSLEAAKSLNQKLTIVAIGNQRNDYLRDQVGLLTEVDFFETNLLPVELLNYCMSLVQLSIITTPVDGLNKSGAAIAWMERGVPILISGLDKKYNTKMQLLGVHQIKSSADILLALQNRGKIFIKSRLGSVAKRYAELSYDRPAK